MSAGGIHADHRLGRASARTLRSVRPIHREGVPPAPAPGHRHARRAPGSGPLGGRGAGGAPDSLLQGRGRRRVQLPHAAPQADEGPGQLPGRRPRPPRRPGSDGGGLSGGLPHRAGVGVRPGERGAGGRRVPRLQQLRGRAVLQGEQAAQRHRHGADPGPGGRGGGGEKGGGGAGSRRGAAARNGREPAVARSRI